MAEKRSTSKILNSIENNISVIDQSFTSVLLFKDISKFYGSDDQNNRDTYLSALTEALKSRIADPMYTWGSNLKACFFKPLNSRSQAYFNTFFAMIPLSALVDAITLIGGTGAATSNPILMGTLLCLPAVTDLFIAIVDLLHALGQEIKSCYYSASDPFKSNVAHAQAGAFLMDSMVRFALVIPLLVTNLLMTPFEVLRFATRMIGTLVNLFQPLDFTPAAPGLGN